MLSFGHRSRFVFSRVVVYQRRDVFHSSLTVFSNQKFVERSDSPSNAYTGNSSEQAKNSTHFSAGGTVVENPVSEQLNSSSGNSTSVKEKGSSDPFSATPPRKKIQIAIIGSGPSGCFVATALTKQRPWIHVDIFERLPVPFGLSRYGVSPDHPNVKNVEKPFMKLFKSGQVTWMGNITIGRDIPLSLLLQHYAGVVFSSGADRSATLNVPGRDLDGVMSASDVVSNYNTMPFPYGSPRFSPIPFKRAKNVSIIGNGNVALDIARYLSLPYQHFAGTDMNCYTVRELLQNRVQAVHLIGRRSVPYSSFTIAAFRELATISRKQVRVHADPFDLTKANALFPSPHTNPRVHRRLMELVHSFSTGKDSSHAHSASMKAYSAEECISNTLKEKPVAVVGDSSLSPCHQNAELLPVSILESGEPDLQDAADKLHQAYIDFSDDSKNSTAKHLSLYKEVGGHFSSALPRGPCDVRFRFNLTVDRFLPMPKGADSHRNRLGGILLRHTVNDDVHSIFSTNTTPDAKNAGGDSEGTPSVPQGTSVVANPTFFVLPCEVAIQSIGYQSDINSTVKELPTDSATGRILNVKGRVEGMRRIYCSGWAKNGPKGVILHSLSDASETAKMIVEDIESEAIPTRSTKETTMQGKFGLLDYFISKKLEPVSVAGLERVLEVERQRGIDLGKAAEKMDSIRDMLDVALGGELGKKTAAQFRGITPTRALPLMYLKELLDDETDLSDFAHSLAKDMPHRLAEQHPPGALSPSQL